MSDHATMHPPPARIYTLGPEGTFSDQAAQRLATGLGLAGVPITYTRTIPEVMAHTEAEPDALGVVPIENSVAGTVTQTQDNLLRHHQTILWEINIRVRFSLVADGPLERVEVLLAHPQAYDQCAEYLAGHLPQAQVRFTNSNVASGLSFLEERGTGPMAAIVPVEFGAQHRELVAGEDIQDFANNTTRFLVTRRRDEAAPDLARDKTSLLIEPQADRPGLLYELLSIFNRHGINLSRLESRPSKVTPWVYVFFIDFNNNAASAACLEELRTTANRITVLGSYDLLE
jgi:prephenate dehydratase